MAQVQDLSGLLTGISSQAPIDPRVGLSPMQQLQARGMEANQGLRQAAGGLMSSITGKEVNVQTSRERAQTELAGLDINKPKDQPRILEIYTRLDPNKAAQLKAAFAQQGRVRDKESDGLLKEQVQRKGFSDYLENAYPNKGYGALALQGMITPANMKNFIKSDSSKKTTTATISEGGVNKLVVLNEGGEIVQRYDAEISGTSNPNAPNYFRENIVRDGKEVSVMFQRVGDVVSEVATLGTTSLPEDDAQLEKVEVTKEDGQTYIQFLDLNKPEGKRLLHEQKKDENRVITEGVDLLTGQTVKYTTLPDGTGRIPFGITKLPEYSIKKNNNGTFDVFNITLGALEQEGVPTQESARLLVAKKQKTQETLSEIDRQIGFINEAKTLTESYDPTDAVVLHPLMKYVPYSDAKYLENLTETLKSRIGRDALMELREGSAVGSTGLGALNLKELEMLQNALGMLDPTVGDARFRKQLDIVKTHYKNFRATLMGRPSEINWANPAYREFTRTISDEQGNPQVYYTLSDEMGVPLSGNDGKPMWYLAKTFGPSEGDK